MVEATSVNLEQSSSLSLSLSLSLSPFFLGCRGLMMGFGLEMKINLNIEFVSLCDWCL